MDSKTPTWMPEGFGAWGSKPNSETFRISSPLPELEVHGTWEPHLWVYSPVADSH